MKTPASTERLSPGFVLVAFLATATAFLFLHQSQAQKNETMKTATTTTSTETKTMSDAELRQRLTPEQYHVTKENGTEPPFQNEYWDNHEAGIYVDVVSRRTALQLARQVRLGHGLAELHQAARERKREEKSDGDFA